MKKFLALIIVVCVSGTPALAPAQPADKTEMKTTAPIELTDTEMDQVTGGALISVEVSKNNILNNLNVNASAAVAAAVAVLGASGAGAASAAKLVPTP